MIKSHARTVDGQKGVEVTIIGDEEVLFNEFRALFIKVSTVPMLNRIVDDALNSLIQDDIIKNFKENK